MSNILELIVGIKTALQLRCSTRPYYQLHRAKPLRKRTTEESESNLLSFLHVVIWKDIAPSFFYIIPLLRKNNIMKVALKVNGHTFFVFVK